MNILRFYFGSIADSRDLPTSVASGRGAAPVLDLYNNKWAVNRENVVTTWVAAILAPVKVVSRWNHIDTVAGGVSWL